MTEIKVGTRIRVLADGANSARVKAGDLGTVFALGTQAGNYKVRMDEFRGGSRGDGWYLRREHVEILSPVEAFELKLGDRVRRTQVTVDVIEGEVTKELTDFDSGDIRIDGRVVSTKGEGISFERLQPLPKFKVGDLVTGTHGDDGVVVEIDEGEDEEPYLVYHADTGDTWSWAGKDLTLRTAE